MSPVRFVCRCHGVFLWCYVYFVLLRFRLYAFVQAATFRSIVLRYAGAPIASRVSFFYFFYFSVFGDVPFSVFWGGGVEGFSISVFSLYGGEYVVRSFLPDGVLFYLTTGWIFDISLRENSIQNLIQCSVDPTRPTLGNVSN